MPGSLSQVIPHIARKGVKLSMGMAVGLIPISGTIISEDRAMELLAEVRCAVIGRGGAWGAEGGTTMQIEGGEKQVRAAFEAAWR